MFEESEIDSRVNKRHPELLKSDVSSAWQNAMIVFERSGGSLPNAILVAVGAD